MYNEWSDRLIGQPSPTVLVGFDDPNMVYAAAVYANTFAPQEPQSLAPIPYWRFREIVILVISGILVSGVFGVPTYLMMLVVSDPSPNGELVALSCAGMMVFVAVLIGTLVVGQAIGRSWADLGFRRPSISWLIGGVFLSAMLLPIRLLVVLIVLGIPANKTVPADEQQLMVVDNWLWLALMVFLFTAVVLAPLTEELVFRAVLYGWMRRAGGMIGAALVSGILFGLAHLDVRMALANSIMGVVLALVYERSRSLWVPIAMHFVNNLITGGLLFIALVLVAAGGT